MTKTVPQERLQSQVGSTRNPEIPTFTNHVNGTAKLGVIVTLTLGVNVRASIGSTNPPSAREKDSRKVLTSRLQRNLGMIRKRNPRNQSSS